MRKRMGRRWSGYKQQRVRDVLKRRKSTNPGVKKLLMMKQSGARLKAARLRAVLKNVAPSFQK
jgi:hypothetical protein